MTRSAIARARGLRGLPPRPLLLGALRPDEPGEGLRVLRGGRPSRPPLRRAPRRPRRRPPPPGPRRCRPSARGLGSHRGVRRPRSRPRPVLRRGSRVARLRPALSGLGLGGRAARPRSGHHPRSAPRLGPSLARALPGPRRRPRGGTRGRRPRARDRPPLRSRSRASVLLSRDGRRVRGGVGPRPPGRRASARALPGLPDPRARERDAREDEGGQGGAAARASC